MIKKISIYFSVAILAITCLCGCGESGNSSNNNVNNSTSSVETGIKDDGTTSYDSSKETIVDETTTEEVTTEEETTTEKPHEWNEGEITLEATCKDEGIITYTCLICSETKEESIPILTEHTWDEGTITVEASCSLEGTKTYTCVVCEETYTDVVEKNDKHKWDAGTVILEAECNKAGKKQFACTLCSATKEESVAATNKHQYGEGTITVKPTCGTEGTKEYTCTKCGNVKKDKVSPDGSHSWNDGRVTKDATIQAAGTYTYTCTTCFGEKNDTIPKLTDDKTTVYSTDKILYVGKLPVYGIVRINDEYYIPLEMFKDPSQLPDEWTTVWKYDTYYELRIRAYKSYKDIHYVQRVYSVPNNKFLGTARETDMYLKFNDQVIDAKLWDMNGENPLVNLKDLGAVPTDTGFYLDVNMDEDIVFVPERDLIGEILPTLQKSTSKETAKAIHDFIVNKLTYDPRISEPSWATETLYAQVTAIFTEVEKEFQTKNNITVASNYGVCNHYADLFTEMCNRMGIPCITTTGVGNGGPHAWNKVYIDGTWELVDCTFDDPISKTPVYDDDYFMMSPDVFAKNHYWTGADYPYLGEYDESWNDLDVNNITSRTMYRRCFIAQIMQGKTSFSLRPVSSKCNGGDEVLFHPLCDGKWFSMSGKYNKTTGAYEYVIGYW